MDAQGHIRWGILSTANIAHSSFLPGVRATGTGVVQGVAGRDRARTEAFARDNGIQGAVEGYELIIEDPSIDAIYNPLPNSLHAEWTARALRAGKAVLCEKPLCISVTETEWLLREASQSGALLWEAFVFPFRRQNQRIQEIIDSGAVGELRAVESSFHFKLTRREGNIRMSPALGGGALNDVGCYPVHFGSLLFGTDPLDGQAQVTMTPEGVDGTADGILRFDGNRTLHFSCGMVDRSDIFGRIVCSNGDIRLSNPFHPNQDDTLEIRSEGHVETEHPVGDEPSFTAALQHIHRVLREEEAPRHLALGDALRTARGLQMARESAGIH